MDMFPVSEDKREVPPMLKKILRYDIQITKKFVDIAIKTTALRSLRNHAMFLEISCHGVVWLAGWLSFIWLFNHRDLYEVQVNMLMALILDIIVIGVAKAFTRRRRPIPMNKMLNMNPDKFSFPSGHASRSAMIVFILFYQSSVPIFFYPPLLAWVTSVCLSRILSEKHYILDVLAGISVGILEAFLISLIWLSQDTSASILSSIMDEKKDGGEYHV